MNDYFAPDYDKLRQFSLNDYKCYNKMNENHQKKHSFVEKKEINNLL